MMNDEKDFYRFRFGKYFKLTSACVFQTMNFEAHQNTICAAIITRFDVKNDTVVTSSALFVSDSQNVYQKSISSVRVHADFGIHCVEWL